MSAYRIAEGQVLFRGATPQEIQAAAVVLQESNYIYNIKQLDVDEISFQMDGCSGIDYEPLKETLPKITEIAKSFTIETHEFELVTDSGFDYDTEEK